MLKPNCLIDRSTAHH